MTELARNGGTLDERARDRHRLRLPDRGAGADRRRGLHGRAHRRAGRQGAAQPAVAQGEERAADAWRRHRRISARTLAVDAIVVTAGATHVPTALLKYLKPGGRMVLPLAQRERRRRRRAAAHRDRGDARRLPGADARCGKIRAIASRPRVTRAASHVDASISRSTLPLASHAPSRTSSPARGCCIALRVGRSRAAPRARRRRSRIAARAADAADAAPVAAAGAGAGTAAEPEAPGPTYTVKRGDTLYQIALDNGLDYRELAAWNTSRTST